MRKEIRQRVFLLPTLCAVKSSDFARTNESIARPWGFIFNFLVLDFKFPLASCKRIGNPATFLLVESGILGFGVRNTVQAIRTPTND